MVAGIASDDQRYRYAPIYVAGNSLGQYNALIAAGAITFEDWRLVIIRAQTMQKACDETQSGLIYPRIRKPEQVIEIRRAQEASGAVVCLRNTDLQIILGGTKEELFQATAFLKERGIDSLRLPVAGAFHHPKLMASAKDKVAAAVKEANIKDSRIPIIGNTTGEPIQTRNDIEQELVDQVVMPVLWDKSMRFLIDQGFDHKIEIGEQKSFINLHRNLIDNPVIDPIRNRAGEILAHALSRGKR